MRPPVKLLHVSIFCAGALVALAAQAQSDGRSALASAGMSASPSMGSRSADQAQPESPRQGAPAAASTPVLAIAKDYRIGPNDLLEVEVLDIDNMKRTVRVNAAGAVSLPLIGATPVAGLTSQEAEDRIADKYREKYLQNPQVSVFIKEFTTERITVEGAVAHPGMFPLAGQMTLLRALALAGGFGPIANPREVMLFRRNEKQGQVFDVEQIRSGKTEDPAIRGDDLIVVQQDSSRRVFKDSLFRDVLDSLNPFAIFARP
jgi:polysaccharide export outer membrane protein